MANVERKCNSDVEKQLSNDFNAIEKHLWEVKTLKARSHQSSRLDHGLNAGKLRNAYFDIYILKLV